jgi:FkbM family methyltransferase
LDNPAFQGLFNNGWTGARATKDPRSRPIRIVVQSPLVILVASLLMDLSLKAAQALFKYGYAIYRPVYFRFKRRADRHEIGLLRQVVKPGARVLDIGANIGFYSSLLAELAGPSGHVHAFEPDPLNFKRLQRAVGDRPTITLHHAAVADKPGTLKLYLSDRLNVDHRTYEPESYDKVVEVKAVRIDDVVGAERVDVIKMDIQGFEAQALGGMLHTLRNNAHLVLLSEFWPYGLRRSGSSARAYRQALLDLGFHAWILRGADLVPLDEHALKEIEDLPETSYFNLLASTDEGYAARFQKPL